MSSDLHSSEQSDKNGGRYTSNFATLRTSLLNDIASSAICHQGLFLLQGEQAASRNEFLSELKHKLILKGSSVFEISQPVNTFSEFILLCLEQQQQGEHTQMGILPLTSDGAHIFFSGEQPSVFQFSTLHQVSDIVIMGLIQSVATANAEGHHVSILFADDQPVTERLERLGCSDAVIESFRMPLLDGAMVRDHIENLLALSNTNDIDYAFSPGAIREISSLANGNFSKVNELFSKAFKRVKRNEDPIVTAQMIKEIASERIFKIHSSVASQEADTDEEHAEWVVHKGEGVAAAAGGLASANRHSIVSSPRFGQYAFISLVALIPIVIAGYYTQEYMADKNKQNSLAAIIEDSYPSGNSQYDITPLARDSRQDPAMIADRSETDKDLQEDSSSEHAIRSDTVPGKLAAQEAGTGTAAATMQKDTLVTAETLQRLKQVLPAAAKPLQIKSYIRGYEDTNIPLEIGIGVTLKDRVYLEIRGVPVNTSLTQGTQRGDTWYVSSLELDNLELVPEVNKDDNYQLTVNLRENGSGNLISTASASIELQPVADKPFMSISAASGDQYTAIPLEIDVRLSDRDGSEELRVEIAGVPDSVKVSAGIRNAAGIWVLTQKDLANLILTPGAGVPRQLNLQIRAIAREKNNNSLAILTDTVTIAVIPGSR
ncbi:MAG: hypothetical protein V3W04_14895 [Gammaproteobacteria bacterium]